MAATDRDMARVPLFPPHGSRVPVYRSDAVSSMDAGTRERPDWGTPVRRGYEANYGVEIRTQSRRPINTQSWVRRRSAMLMASQMATAVSAIVKASAAMLASMR